MKIKVFLFSVMVSVFETVFANDPWFPFVLPWDDDTSTFVDLRTIFNSPPIASNDFISMRGGHPTVNGTRIRFWGGCLLGPNLCPTHEVADKLAPRFAKFGVNLIRFQYMDSMFMSRKGDNTRELDPEKLERFDYLVAQLKKQNIYVIFQLGWDRPYKDGDGVPVSSWTKSGLDAFYINSMSFCYPPLRELEQELASNIFSHKNPYTGFSYAHEPAVAFVEIHNEAGLIDNDARKRFDRLPEPVAGYFRETWNRFLLAKYANQKRLSEAWGDGVQEDENCEKSTIPYLSTSQKINRGKRALQDWDLFLVQTEMEYYRLRAKQLREELGVKVPISGSSITFSRSMLQIGAGMDYTDNHVYFGHPNRLTEKGFWWSFDNSSMLESKFDNYETDWPQMLFQARTYNRPYLISEFNTVSQNPYGVAAFPLVASYMSLQDLDGFAGLGLYIWRENVDQPYIMAPFEIANDPVKMATFIPSAVAFRRGDIKPSKNIYYVHSSLELETETGGRPVTAQKLGLPKGLSLISRTGIVPKGERPPPGGVAFGGTLPSNPYVSDSDEIKLDTSSGIFSVNTEKSKFLAGFLKSEEYQIGDIRIKILDESGEHVVMTFTDLTRPDEGLKSRSLLFCALGSAINEDARFYLKEKNNYVETAYPPPKGAVVAMTKTNGLGPTVVRGVSAKIFLPVKKDRLSVRPLDVTGAPKKDRLDVSSDGDGCFFQIKSTDKTIWYRIDISP